MAGTDALVAIVATPHRARVYFCGGSSSFETLTRWFTVDIASSGDAVVEPDAGDWQLQARFDAQGATGAAGTVTPGDGVARSFQAAAVATGTIAGLYEELAAPCGHIGLIVEQPAPGSAPIGQGACIGPGPAPGAPAKVLQVNPLEPLVRTSDGTIAVVVAGASEQELVHAAAPPSN
jgi:hypothetical protein